MFFKKVLDYLNNLNARQVLILAGIAAALMFATLYFLFTMITAKEEANVETVPVETPPSVTTVIVAKTDIAPRAVIRESMVELKEMLTENVPNGAITSMDEVTDLPARVTIMAGDIITSRKLYKDSDSAGYVGAIPPDCRAVAINVNDVTGVAGFAKPGDHVDLMLVEKADDSATTNIILQNVLLLSINQSMDRNDFETNKEGDRNTGAAVGNPTIATFALRPQEALRLISASKLGDIYLMLRPAKPVEMYVDDINYKVISANAKPKVETAPPPVTVTPPTTQPQSEPEPQPPKKFVIIQGDEVQTSGAEDNATNKGSN